LLCLSHLRWDFVFQRPQHLLTQAAATYEVIFFEEPEPTAQPDDAPHLQVRRTQEGVLVATPLLPSGLDVLAAEASLRELLDKMLSDLGKPVAVTWYYTPMALAFAGHVRAGVVVYDCMDELTLFRGASPRLALLERQLLKRADLVFTGGRSLHEAKRRFHPRTHLFPSSVDTAHFGRARSDAVADPAYQADLPKPRIGFFGVLDERIDFALVDSVAAARPEWQLVMLGPTAKIDPAALPRRANLHWLGMKSYAELPEYLAGWSAGLMPFALNEATRFISPTKTPEFLAAGVPLVSTPVPDVVADWGLDKLVGIADGADQIVSAIEAVMARPRQPWLTNVDRRLGHLSWRATWVRMRALIESAAESSGTKVPVGAVSRS
jgi:UDP-galactopyranose mutase